MTAQLKAKAITVKASTLLDARWVKHKGKAAVHGFKAHVGADAATALAERISITPANVNDGRAGPDALPDDPGEVFADSAYRGSHFGGAVRAKGGTPRVVATGIWSRDERKRSPASMPGISRSTACAAGSRRSSAPGDAATACAECDGAASPKPPSRSTSPPKDEPGQAPAGSGNRLSARYHDKNNVLQRPTPTRTQVS